MSQFRPMLGVAATLADIKYPVIASPKLDGIRCLCLDGELVSRTLKPIPNHFTRVSLPREHGWDGELIVGDPTATNCYTNTVSGVMTQQGRPSITWYLFDDFSKPYFTYLERSIFPKPPPEGIQILEHRAIFSQEELLKYEDEKVGEGYEGLILRDPRSTYKHGRSTLREQGMLKLKRFIDDEAKVVDFEELMHNANAAQLDERGLTKRSSHQENKIPTGTLGALVVEWRGQHLRLGTGFTAADRGEIWNSREQWYGKLVKFKYLPVGMKDLPRHPVFLGLRHPEDI